MLTAITHTVCHRAAPKGRALRHFHLNFTLLSVLFHRAGLHRLWRCLFLCLRAGCAVRHQRCGLCLLTFQHGADARLAEALQQAERQRWAGGSCPKITAQCGKSPTGHRRYGAVDMGKNPLMPCAAGQKQRAGISNAALRLQALEGAPRLPPLCPRGQSLPACGAGHMPAQPSQ